jgi:F0F1-type ATP synthase epsilon subunit
MKVNVITAQEKLLDEEASEVILPGADGELSVMDFHQPFLYYLRAGQIRVRSRVKKGELAERKIPIKKGIANFQGNTLTLIIEAR